MTSEVLLFSSYSGVTPWWYKDCVETLTSKLHLSKVYAVQKTRNRKLGVENMSEGENVEQKMRTTTAMPIERAGAPNFFCTDFVRVGISNRTPHSISRSVYCSQLSTPNWNALHFGRPAPSPVIRCARKEVVHVIS